MSPRLIVSLTAVVATAHWLVLWGPLHTPWLPDWDTTPTEPARVATVWVEAAPAPMLPPAPQEPVALPSPPSAPPPRRPARKAVPVLPPSQPQPLTIPAAAQAVETVPPPTTTSTPPVDPTTDTTSSPSAAAAPVLRPSLQLRDANGATLPLQLPGDGSALAQDMVLRYQVHGWVDGMEYHAHAVLQWHSDGQHYQARQSVSAFLLGSLEQTSSGTLSAQGLQPVEFMDRRMFKRRHVYFDWAQHLAVFEPQRPSAAIGPGAQDRLSALLQLAAMLHTLPVLRQPGTQIEIPTLGARRLQMWVFVVEGMEAVPLPAGQRPALRLRRLPQAGDEEHTQLWLDPAQGYVPVRIHMQEPNGNVMDFSLKP